MSKIYAQLLASGFIWAQLTTAFAAQINVTTLLDESVYNADCSLREAIVAANLDSAYNGCVAGSGDDTIGFSVNGIIKLTSSLPVATKSLSVIGPGVARLIVDGNEQYRLFSLVTPAHNGSFLFSGFSLLDGATSTMGESCAISLQYGEQIVIEKMVIGGMRKNVLGAGGAISTNSSNLTVRQTTFFDNQTMEGSGGAIDAFNSTVLVEDSTFVNNHVNGTTEVGGAISVSAQSSVTVRRSTFSGNSSGYIGGAISMVSSIATLDIESSTIVGYTAAKYAGGIFMNAGVATISNTVVSTNLINPIPVGDPKSDVTVNGGTLNTSGYNFIGDNTGAATVFPVGNPNINKDFVGTHGALLDPGLAVLANNGGPTRTHLPLPTSPLIDQGSCTGEPFDQRNFSNLVDGRIIDVQSVANADDGCDIGAVEAFSFATQLLFSDGFETAIP